MALITPDIARASIDPSVVLLPIYSGKVQAGQSRFASPAQDYEPLDGQPLHVLDLNERFIIRPAATFLLDVIGDSMIGVGIYSGRTTLIVEKSLKAVTNSIVVAVVDGEMMVKRYFNNGTVVKLLSENDNELPILIKEGQDAWIWGVVKSWPAAGYIRLFRWRRKDQQPHGCA